MNKGGWDGWVQRTGMPGHASAGTLERMPLRPGLTPLAAVPSVAALGRPRVVPVVPAKQPLQPSLSMEPAKSIPAQTLVMRTSKSAKMPDGDNAAKAQPPLPPPTAEAPAKRKSVEYGVYASADATVLAVVLVFVLYLHEVMRVEQFLALTSAIFWVFALGVGVLAVRQRKQRDWVELLDPVIYAMAVFTLTYGVALMDADDGVSFPRWLPFAPTLLLLVARVVSGTAAALREWADE